MSLRRARCAKACSRVGEDENTGRVGRKARHVSEISHAVNVLALTVFVGFVLVSLFVLLWFAAACDPRSFSDREALLPLDDETPSVPQTPAKSRPLIQ